MHAPAFKDSHSEIYSPSKSHASTTLKKANVKDSIADIRSPGSENPQSFPLISWNPPVEEMALKQLHPYYGVVSGVYYAMTGMPWLSADARKAVKTEWFWQPIRGQPRRVDTNELRKYANTIWIQSIVMTIQKQISNVPWDILPLDEETPYEAVEDEILKVKSFFEHPNKNNESWDDIVCAWVKDIEEIDAGVLVKVYTIDSYDFEHLEPRSGAPLLKPLVCPECSGKNKITRSIAQAKAARVIDAIIKAENSLPDEYSHKIIGGEEIIKEKYKLIKPDYEPIKTKMMQVVSANSAGDENVVDIECPFCNGTGTGRQVTEIYCFDGACLKHGTMIETDAGFLPIGKIVNEKIACKVKSYNRETNSIEWKPVTNWFNNGITTDWMRIKAKTNRKFRSLNCTPNHNILTPEGYKKAEELELGETIYTQREALSKDQRQIVLGSILGDASLGKGSTKHSKLKFSETHGIKQKDYLLWKAEMLESLGIRVDRFFSKYGEGYEPTEKIRIQTRASMVFEEFYDLKYPELKPEIVDELNELGLAIWIQDDGHKSKRGELKISCGKIKKETLEKIAKKLNKKFETSFKVYDLAKENLLYLNKISYASLSQKIKPFVHSTMAYKTEEDCGTALDSLSKELKLEIVETEIFEKSEFKYYDARYDIEVADNHNFFAQGLLVSNSFLKDCDRTGWTYGYWQYSYAIPAHPMWFNRDEIIYYMANPRGFSVYGYSPLQSSLESVKSLEYSVRHNMSLFLDGAVPDGVVSVEDMSDESLKRMKASWEQELKGQPHKVVFLNKKTTFSPFAFNNRDMQFLEGQKQTWLQVMANFGVSPVDIGIFEDVNRATAGSAAELGRRKAIRPILKKIEDLVNSQLLPELGAVNVKFAYVVDDPVEERMKAELNEIYVRSGIKSVNEIRIEQGLPPVSWGDGPSNPMQRIGLDGQKPSEVEGIQDTQDAGEQGPQDAKEKGAFNAQVPFITTLQNLSTPLPFAVPRSGHPNSQYPYNAMSGICPGCGKPGLLPVGESPEGISIGRWYQCRFCHRTFTEESLATAESEQQHMHQSGELTDPFKRPQLIDQTIQDILSDKAQTMSPTAPIPNLIPTVRPRKKTAGLNVKKKVEQVSGAFLDTWVGFQTAPLMAFVNQFLQGYEFEQVTGTKKKKSALKEIFNEAFFNGMNLHQLAGEIESAGFEPENADMIARTETIRIANEAKLLQAEAQGYTKVIFVATHDAHVCPTCLALDGKIMTIAEAKGLIPVHVRCRCTYRVVIE